MTSPATELQSLRDEASALFYRVTHLLNAGDVIAPRNCYLSRDLLRVVSQLDAYIEANPVERAYLVTVQVTRRETARDCVDAMDKAAVVLSCYGEIGVTTGKEVRG